MKKDVIIALDFDSREKAMTFLDMFGDVKPYVKVGMELFYAEGPRIVKDIKERGNKVFLDLKLHDIPNTVGSTMRALSALDIDMVNIHASGTIKMMRAAVRAFDGKEKRPLIVAVTQLTSTEQKTLEKELLIKEKMNDVVMKYACSAKKAGLDGVVCSPLEARDVHKACGSDFITVTPGIRLEKTDKMDQARVTTPSEARTFGSDYIVVGRPITRSEDPLGTYLRFMKDFGGEK